MDTMRMIRMVGCCCRCIHVIFRIPSNITSWWRVPDVGFLSVKLMVGMSVTSLLKLSMSAGSEAISIMQV